MKISVIIPTYKPQTYLWECLDSVCNQTLSKDNFEVILVLNGCKEPFHSEINQYISHHKDINWNFIQTDEGGASNARNLALDNAKGEYITFIDDDDYVSPSFLQELYEVSDSETVGLSYAYAFKDGVTEKQCKYSVTETYDYCTEKGLDTLASRARRYFSGPWMKLIPKTFINDRRFNTNFQMSEDCIFMFSISDKIHKVAFTSRKAVYYRRFRPNSISFSNRSKIKDIKNNIACIKEYTKIYFSGGYNTYFYLSRIAAAIMMTYRSIRY